MSTLVYQQLARCKRQIARRIRHNHQLSEQPVLAAANIHYQFSARLHGLAFGGIGAVHLLARKSGLIDALNRRLHLLKVHLPYHESDHVLAIAYSGPLVSLPMAVFNTRAYVNQAIESIVRQSYAQWELLLWDDGSTDGSAEVLQEWARRDARIRLLGGTHLGAAGAMAALTAASIGPYLGWVDSDDWLAPEALTQTVAVLEQWPLYGAVYTDYYDTDPSGRVHSLGSRCSIPYSRDRLLVDFMTFHFRLIRRSIYVRAGGLDPILPSAEDYDLCLKLAELTEFYHLAKPLYYYRHHAGSASNARRLEQIEWAAEVIPWSRSHWRMRWQL